MLTGLSTPRAAWGAPLAAAALIAVIAFEAPRRDPGVDPTEHHDQVRRLAETSIPYSIGDWLGRRVEAPAAAVELLHPNVLESRVYRNLRTGESATLLFVHCSDVRDLAGHYPPICYPANGLALKRQSPRDWTVGDSTLYGVRYRFRGKDLTSAAETVVDNFMVLPTGGTGRDMTSVRKIAGDTRKRRLGAAEVQVLTDGSMSDERRDEVLRTLLEPVVPLIQSVAIEAYRD